MTESDFSSANVFETNRQLLEHSSAAGFRIQTVYEVLSEGIGLSGVWIINKHGPVFIADDFKDPEKSKKQAELVSRWLALQGAITRTGHTALDGPGVRNYIACEDGCAVCIAMATTVSLNVETIFQIFFSFIKKFSIGSTNDSGYDPDALSPYWLSQQGLLKKFSQSNAPVVLSGPSGAGKDFIAKYIHKASGRSGAFVHIHLPTIPSELFEVELFGAVAGAFTGAESRRQGRLSAAEKGTVYFDDISDISPELQAKLLRVLEDESFTPVGSNNPISLNARIISSTKKDLHELAGAGEFREDLLYRVNVLPLYVPPLSSRPQDFDFFVKSFRSHVADESLIDKVLPGPEILLSKKWPGNIRQLFSYLQRISIGVPENQQPSQTGAQESETDLKTALLVYKRQLIRDILLRCSGNITEAARILDIQRTYLSRLIRELSIYPEQEY